MLLPVREVRLQVKDHPPREHEVERAAAQTPQILMLGAHIAIDQLLITFLPQAVNFARRSHSAWFAAGSWRIISRMTKDAAATVPFHPLLLIK